MAGRVDQATQWAAIARIEGLSAEAGAIREELARVTQSEAFKASVRSRHLLAHVVEKALAGQFDQLKERAIGTDVFGREPGYDTSEDAIVRVAANEVRKRLAEHYAQHRSRVRIQLPTGTYLPEFQVDSEPPPPDPVLADPPRVTRRRWIPYALAGAVGAGVLAFVRTRPVSPLLLPWSGLLQRDARTYVVTSDTSFAALQDLLGVRLPLADYASRRYPVTSGQSPELARAAGLLLRNQFTSMADAAIAARINHLAAAAGASIIVRGARSMEMREFRTGDNFVLVGSRHANPWLDLVADRIGFAIEFDSDRGIQVCRDRRPAAHQPREYVPTAATGGAGEAYSVVACVRNPGGSGWILSIAGTSMEGTEAAGDFVTDSVALAQALRGAGIDPEGAPRPFEILFHLRALAGAARDSRVLAVRPIAQP